MAASYCFLYVYVSSAGLNYLHFCNLNSFRTLFILGFSCFTAISLPQYFRDYQRTSNSSPLHTHARWFNDTKAVIFIPMVVVMIGMLLYNTVNCEEDSASEDSGKHWWDRFIQFAKDIRNLEFYSLPGKLGNCFPSL